MEIIFFGHSCFRLRWEQASLVTDPFEPDSLGLRLADVTASAVTVSCEHPHHNGTTRVGGDARVFRGPGEYEYLGALVKGVMTPRGAEDGREGRNTAYHIEVEGVRLAHLGVVAGRLGSREVDELTPADVVFVPAGGGVLGVKEALEVARGLGPKIVVPMGFSLPGMAVELGPVEAFLREAGVGETEAQARLNVTATNLPAELRVVVLNAQGARGVRAGQGALL